MSNLNKPPVDIDSIVNLKYLKDTFINRQKISEQLKETNHNIDKFIEEYLNQYMFSLDKLQKIDYLILNKDLQKFTFLGLYFIHAQSAKSRIEKILQMKYIDKYIINNFFSQNLGKKLKNVVIDGILKQIPIENNYIKPSIFMDIQNKRFYFIPSNIKPKITIDYENNQLVILFDREIIGYRNRLGLLQQDTRDIPTVIFGNNKIPYMELKIDINTLKITSNGV